MQEMVRSSFQITRTIETVDSHQQIPPEHLVMTDNSYRACDGDHTLNLQATTDAHTTNSLQDIDDHKRNPAQINGSEMQQAQPGPDC